MNISHLILCTSLLAAPICAAQDFTEPEAAAPQLPNDEEKGIESLEQKDPDELTLGEARALAIHMGIEVPSGVRKVDIIRAIKDHHEVAEE